MKTIDICIGSACHLKGSYQVIETFKRILESKALEREIELKAAFCLGECSKAVAVRFDNKQVISVAPEEAETIFLKYIEGNLNGDN